MARLLVLKAAHMHDKYGSKKARKEVSITHGYNCVVGGRSRIVERGDADGAQF